MMCSMIFYVVIVHTNIFGTKYQFEENYTTEKDAIRRVEEIRNKKYIEYIEVEKKETQNICI